MTLTSGCRCLSFFAVIIEARPGGFGQMNLETHHDPHTQPPAQEGRMQNHLLAVLPEPLYERLLPHLTLVALPLGEALYESGGALTHIFFPRPPSCPCCTSRRMAHPPKSPWSATKASSASPSFMGGETMPNRAVVQSEGHGLSAERRGAQAGIQPLRRLAASAAALHPGPADPDGADRRLQSAPYGGPATLSLAAAQPRPAALERAAHDPGADRQYAGGAPRGRDRGGRKIAESPD